MTRVFDLVIGILAMTAALVTLGKVDVINNVAYRGLQVTGIVKDIFYNTTKMLNPWMMA